MDRKNEFEQWREQFEKAVKAAYEKENKKKKEEEKKKDSKWPCVSIVHLCPLVLVTGKGRAQSKPAVPLFKNLSPKSNHKSLQKLTGSVHRKF